MEAVCLGERAPPGTDLPPGRRTAGPAAPRPPLPGQRQAIRAVGDGTPAASAASMTPPDTFTELARRLAREGAGSSCDAEAARLGSSAATARPPRARVLRRAALGLAMAARQLGRLGTSSRTAPFRPIGLRGAAAAGAVALASGRLRLAELIGLAAAEAAPDSPAGLRLAGQALFAQARYPAAERALAAALALDPLDAFSRALHAEALLFGGEPRAGRRALASLRLRGEEAAPLACALERAVRVGALGGRAGLPGGATGGGPSRPPQASEKAVAP